MIDVGLTGNPQAVAERVTRFTYEPLFQRLSTMRAPDNTLTQLYYDYQQMSVSEPQAKALLNRLRRSTGRDLLVGSGLFLNQDLDGDGLSGIETSNELVLSVVKGVELGDDTQADVGERITRDDCGEVTNTYRIADWDDASQDTDRAEVLYYKDLVAAESGSDETNYCRCACGPVALTRKYRTPDATAADDLDEVKLIYDALGGVSESTANDDPETTVVTLRNSVGLIVEEQRPNDLTIARTYDSRGQLRRETAVGIEMVEHVPTPVTLSDVVFAWGNQGVALGSCRRLTPTGCADFQAYALEVVRARRADLELPQEPAGSSVVPFIDEEDVDIGFVDAAEGRTDRTRNAAGFVVEELTDAAPNDALVATFAYDNMGRLIAETRGEVNPVKQFHRYDGFGRLTDSQSNGDDEAVAFVPNEGTIATTRFDLLDRATTSFVVGNNGLGNRRVLGMSRTVRNSIGAPLFTHSLAQSALPSTLPALPNGAIVNGDAWATEALTYDAALRVQSHLPEGRTLATIAAYDGFGMNAIDAPTRGVVIDIIPRQRRRTTTHSLVGEGASTSSRSYTELSEWDGVGNTTLTRMTDLGNNVDRTSTATFDALGRARSATDPTGRTIAVAFDWGGRMIADREGRRDRGA